MHNFPWASLHSKVQTSSAMIFISGLQNIGIFLVSQKLNQLFNMSGASFAQIKEKTLFSLSRSRNAWPRFPLDIEITFIQSLNNFELISFNPIFTGVMIKINRELRLYHRDGKFFGREWLEAFAHKLVNDVLGCVARRRDSAPMYNFLHVLLSWKSLDIWILLLLFFRCRAIYWQIGIRIDFTVFNALLNGLSIKPGLF